MDGGVANDTPISHAIKLVVLPPPCPLSIQPIDFGHARLLIDRAYADTCEFLGGGGAERPPIHMRMHGHGVVARRQRERRLATR
jgi:hypothetical protein